PATGVKGSLSARIGGRAEPPGKTCRAGLTISRRFCPTRRRRWWTTPLRDFAKSWATPEPPAARPKYAARSRTGWASGRARCALVEKRQFLVRDPQQRLDDVVALRAEVLALGPAQHLRFSRRLVQHFGLAGGGAFVLACSHDQHWSWRDRGDMLLRFEHRAVDEPVQQRRYGRLQEVEVEAAAQVFLQPQAVVRCSMNEEKTRQALVARRCGSRERYTQACADHHDARCVDPGLLLQPVDDERDCRRRVEKRLP